MSDQVKDSYRGMEARSFAKGGMPSKDDQIASLRAQLAEAQEQIRQLRGEDLYWITSAPVPEGQS